MSAAGGVHQALLTAARFGCATVQLFTKNNNQWVGKPQTADDVALFRKTLRQTKLKFPTAHDSYLINLASPQQELWRKSIEAFIDEIARAEALGLKYLVMHPGAHVDSGEQAGLARITTAFDEIIERTQGARVMVLLELTAGQGSSLGHRFEHIATILRQVHEAKRLGVCLDTCHVYAAGYELAPKRAYDATWQEFDRLIGIKRLKLFHLNDSKKPLGSRVDRHEHIGQGCLGLEPFRLLMNDPRFATLPMILETPKTDAHGTEMDAVNLQTLRDLMPTKATTLGR